jgi:hypothetical protein
MSSSYNSCNMVKDCLVVEAFHKVEAYNMIEASLTPSFFIKWSK